MKKQHLTLTDPDRATLTELLAKGSLSARTFKRAAALLELDRGTTLTAVSEMLDVDDSTVAIWRNTYRTDGLTFLTDAPRSGRPITIDGAQRATITALACSTPPDGHRRWSLRLLDDKVVEAGFCESMSHTQVGAILKKRPEAASDPDMAPGRWMSRFWRRWNKCWRLTRCPPILPIRWSVVMNDRVS